MARSDPSSLWPLRRLSEADPPDSSRCVDGSAICAGHVSCRIDSYQVDPGSWADRALIGSDPSVAARPATPSVSFQLAQGGVGPWPSKGNHRLKIRARWT